MNTNEKRVDVLADLDVVITSHKQIVGYDKILETKLERLKSLLSSPEQTDRAAQKQEAADVLEDIIEHTKDLAQQEQKVIEESPAVCDQGLEEEVYTYFCLAENLNDFSEKYGFSQRQSGNKEAA